MKQSELELDTGAQTAGPPRRARLTARERLFLQHYLKLRDQAAAYRQISRVSTDASAYTCGSRMMRRIREKIDAGGGDWLDEFGLGLPRLLAELDARLRATETKFYQDEQVAVVEDNGTRMAATRLLAELHKRSLGAESVGDIHQHAHVHVHRGSDVVEQRLQAILGRLERDAS